MLKSLTDSRFSLFWVLFHFALGIASTISPVPVIAWFYTALVAAVYKLIRERGNTFKWLLFILIYLTSFELITRMAYTSPIIPYELGKYMVFIVLFIGIVFGFRKGFSGWAMVILLLPALLVDESGSVTFRNIVFNLLGPINVALAIVFFKSQVLTKDDFIGSLKLMLFPLISVLAYILIKTPKFENVEFGLGSNFETSGGFGGNQISTVLGMGAFLAFLFWRNRWKFSGYRWLDLILLIVFSFRGLLTFSRGGMLGGFLGILIVLAFEAPSGHKDRLSGNIVKLLKIIPVLLVVFITFRVADNITGGQLLLRYKGETRGTLSGRKEKNLNVITSNRFDIFIDDLKLWKQHPVLGVGVGASSHLRENTSGFLAHVELSRLISEHGILGIIYFVLLLAAGYRVFKQSRKGELNPVLLALFIIALFTTFHAATRTYVSPLLIGISMLTIDYSENEESEMEDVSDPV
jgi:hypothetical protein